MKTKYFLQVHVQVTPENSEAVSDFLFGLGAAGLVEENNELVAFFDEPFDEQNLHASISNYLDSLQELYKSDMPISIKTNVLENRDWNAEWKKRLKPLVVSDNILIKPTWVETPIPAPPIIIEIDPEMAFGSGEHATTRMTLQLVEKNILPNSRVLDVGTGTGILAIGALKLGAAVVYGFDTDPICPPTAQRNAHKNRVGERFKTFVGAIDTVRLDPFDMIMANVNRRQIINILPQLNALLADNGVLLISGILDTEEQMICHACEKENLKVTEIRREQEWLAFETRKR
jgi:ribosomal protein L11 methyltransferase